MPGGGRWMNFLLFAVIRLHRPAWWGGGLACLSFYLGGLACLSFYTLGALLDHLFCTGNEFQAVWRGIAQCATQIIALLVDIEGVTFWALLGKRANGADTSVLFFGLAAIFFCQWTRKYCFIIAFYCENLHRRWMNRYPVSLMGGQTSFSMVFQALLMQILNYRFCAISSCELFVCAISFLLFLKAFDVGSMFSK